MSLFLYRVTQISLFILTATVFIGPVYTTDQAFCSEAQKTPPPNQTAATEPAVARQEAGKPKPAPNKAKARAKKHKITGSKSIVTKSTDIPEPGARQPKPKHRKKSSGRCEPQSLTYARQRSGIMRSRTGPENGPLTWFASEKRLGMTSIEPASGSVLILGAHKKHGMPTGHVAFVEQVHLEGPSQYWLVFSHTNYDRKCSLETNIEARYNSAAQTLDIFSGAWQAWGQGLNVAGFIRQEKDNL